MQSKCFYYHSNIVRSAIFTICNPKKSCSTFLIIVSNKNKTLIAVLSKLPPRHHINEFVCFPISLDFCAIISANLYMPLLLHSLKFVHFFRQQVYFSSSSSSACYCCIFALFQTNMCALLISAASHRISDHQKSNNNITIHRKQT